MLRDMQKSVTSFGIEAAAIEACQANFNSLRVVLGSRQIYHHSVLLCLLYLGVKTLRTLFLGGQTGTVAAVEGVIADPGENRKT